MPVSRMAGCFARATWSGPCFWSSRAKSICRALPGTEAKSRSHRAGRGDFFAEASLDAPRYHCNAVASRPTTLLAFPVDKVRALLAKDPQFARQWVALLAGQLHSARARLERVALKSAAERVLHYLRTEGKGPRCEVTLEGTVKDLAHELGLTHESLYRTLARLERDGMVGRGDNRLFLA